MHYIRPSHYHPRCGQVQTSTYMTVNREQYGEGMCFSADTLWRAHVKVTAPPLCFLVASSPVKHEDMQNYRLD